MMKLVIALAALMVVCSAQSSYPYSAYLDTEGNFLIKWDIRSEQKDIEIQLEVKTKGYISFMIASEDGLMGDVLVGGYNDEVGAPFGGYLQDYHVELLAGPSHGAPALDASPDLILQSASYSEETGITTLTVKRSIFTGDADDVAVRPGPLLLGWAFSDSDDLTTVHSAGGFASLALIPA